MESLSDIETSNFKALLTYNFLRLVDHVDGVIDILVVCVTGTG